MNSAGKEHGVEDGDHGAHAHQPELTVKSRLDFANGLQQVFFGSQMLRHGKIRHGGLGRLFGRSEGPKRGIPFNVEAHNSSSLPKDRRAAGTGPAARDLPARTRLLRLLAAEARRCACGPDRPLSQAPTSRCARSSVCSSIDRRLCKAARR